MTNVHLGDLAQSYQLRSENARLRQEMAVLTEELSTGRTKDLAAKVSGDLTPITGIEHDLKRLEGYDTAAVESRLLADTLQEALATAQETAQSVSDGLLLAGSSQDPTAANAAGIASKAVFETIVSTLSVQVGGRSLLSGIATDQSALAPAADMLTDLKTATAGLTSANDVIAAVDAWFGPGGGFETMGYTGAATTLSPVAVGRNLNVTFDITASDGRLRDLLAGAALGALVSEGSLTANAGENVDLAAEAGSRLIAAQTGMATIRAEVGTLQASIENAAQANSTARHALELTRSEIVSVDPYDSATRLENARIQLESLYALTARMSRLSLTDFLR